MSGLKFLLESLRGFAEKKSDVFKSALKEEDMAAEIAQLKAEVLRLQQRVEVLEKSLEEALKVGSILPAVGLSSSSSSITPVLHPSSPLLASSVSASREIADFKEVTQLLRHVAYGEQNEAESLIHKKPELLMCKGNVTDLSKREFKEITGFQYALWALDWHMWKMLLKYMDKEAAALQWAELEEKGTAHGKHFSLVPLIEALNTYVREFDGWNWRRREIQWCHQVGGAQLLLPVHVVNEYCHPTRSFVPVPGFTEEGLERSMKLSEAKGSWFTAIYNGGKLGEKFGVVRYNNMAGARQGWGGELGGRNQLAKGDAEAIRNLWKVRQQQLEALRVELRDVMQVKGLLNVHFPSDVSSLVLTYF